MQTAFDLMDKPLGYHLATINETGPFFHTGMTNSSCEIVPDEEKKALKAIAGPSVMEESQIPIETDREAIAHEATKAVTVDEVMEEAIAEPSIMEETGIPIETVVEAYSFEIGQLRKAIDSLDSLSVALPDTENTPADIPKELERKEVVAHEATKAVTVDEVMEEAIAEPSAMKETGIPIETVVEAYSFEIGQLRKAIDSLDMLSVALSDTEKTPAEIPKELESKTEMKVSEEGNDAGTFMVLETEDPQQVVAMVPEEGIFGVTEDMATEQDDYDSKRFTALLLYHPETYYRYMGSWIDSTATELQKIAIDTFRNSGTLSFGDCKANIQSINEDVVPTIQLQETKLADSILSPNRSYGFEILSDERDSIGDIRSKLDSSMDDFFRLYVLDEDTVSDPILQQRLDDHSVRRLKEIQNAWVLAQETGKRALGITPGSFQDTVFTYLGHAFGSGPETMPETVRADERTNVFLSLFDDDGGWQRYFENGIDEVGMRIRATTDEMMQRAQDIDGEPTIVMQKDSLTTPWLDQFDSFLLAMIASDLPQWLIRMNHWDITHIADALESDSRFLFGGELLASRTDNAAMMGLLSDYYGQQLGRSMVLLDSIRQVSDSDKTQNPVYGKIDLLVGQEQRILEDFQKDLSSIQVEQTATDDLIRLIRNDLKALSQKKPNPVPDEGIASSAQVTATEPIVPKIQYVDGEEGDILENPVDEVVLHSVETKPLFGTKEILLQHTDRSEALFLENDSSLFGISFPHEKTVQPEESVLISAESKPVEKVGEKPLEKQIENDVSAPIEAKPALEAEEGQPLYADHSYAWLFDTVFSLLGTSFGEKDIAAQGVIEEVPASVETKPAIEMEEGQPLYADHSYAWLFDTVFSLLGTSFGEKDIAAQGVIEEVPASVESKPAIEMEEGQPLYADHSYAWLFDTVFSLLGTSFGEKDIAAQGIIEEVPASVETKPALEAEEGQPLYADHSPDWLFDTVFSLLGTSFGEKDIAAQGVIEEVPASVESKPAIEAEEGQPLYADHSYAWLFDTVFSLFGTSFGEKDIATQGVLEEVPASVETKPVEKVEEIANPDEPQSQFVGTEEKGVIDPLFQQQCLEELLQISMRVREAGSMMHLQEEKVLPYVGDTTDSFILPSEALELIGTDLEDESFSTFEGNDSMDTKTCEEERDRIVLAYSQRLQEFVDANGVYYRYFDELATNDDRTRQTQCLDLCNVYVERLRMLGQEIEAYLVNSGFTGFVTMQGKLGGDSVSEILLLQKLDTLNYKVNDLVRKAKSITTVNDKYVQDYASDIMDLQDKVAAYAHMVDSLSTDQNITSLESAANQIEFTIYTKTNAVLGVAKNSDKALTDSMKKDLEDIGSLKENGIVVKQINKPVGRPYEEPKEVMRETILVGEESVVDTTPAKKQHKDWFKIKVRKQMVLDEVYVTTTPFYLSNDFKMVGFGISAGYRRAIGSWFSSGVEAGYRQRDISNHLYQEVLLAATFGLDIPVEKASYLYLMGKAGLFYGMYSDRQGISYYLEAEAGMKLFIYSFGFTFGVRYTHHPELAANQLGLVLRDRLAPVVGIDYQFTKKKIDVVTGKTLKNDLPKKTWYLEASGSPYLFKLGLFDLNSIQGFDVRLSSGAFLTQWLALGGEVGYDNVPTTNSAVHLQEMNILMTLRLHLDLTRNFGFYLSSGAGLAIGFHQGTTAYGYVARFEGGVKVTLAKCIMSLGVAYNLRDSVYGERMKMQLGNSFVPSLRLGIQY